jgi:hypothetical protein
MADKYAILLTTPSNDVTVVENLTPDVISVQGGEAIASQSGSAKIKVKTYYDEKVLSIDVVKTITAPERRELIEFVPGSLMRHIRDSVVGRVPTSAPSDATTRILTSGSSYLTTLELNPSSIMKDVDISGLMFGWNSSGTPGTRSGYIVSPNHFITATHFRPTEFKVISPSGEVHHRTNLTYSLLPGCDLAVGYFSEALPASIKPAKIFPENFNSTKIKANFKSGLRDGYSYTMPCINLLHTIGKASICELYHQHENTQNLIQQTGWNVDIRAIANLSQWWLWSGGSSSPVITLVDNEPILLFCLYYGSSPSMYGGPNVSRYITAINSAMATMQGGGSPHQLLIKDLSSFPSY